MSHLRKNFHDIWDQLRAKKLQFRQYLESVRILNLRGIRDLQVNFSYPVSVVAGPNGCGKSTVLFACACAYDVPGTRVYSPTALFPNLRGTKLADRLGNPKFEYSYLTENGRMDMEWRRSKSWSKSFKGRKNASQPRREMYLRTLANLTSPSEVRSILQIGARDFSQSDLDADLIAFAHRVLPFQYRGLKLLQLKAKDLLFAERQESKVTYSEFHMSAGERALLRISKDIGHLNNALILIDEIEAGLHPATQQQLLLELQRLALRRDLQVIVTSHSPVVLETVPPEARIFLERGADNVSVQPPYKDIFQRAFYGQSQDKLSVLCEDVVAEGLILGVLDNLSQRLNITPDDITVGRDTGKDQFAEHVKALGKFKLLDSFVFVLDGDARSLGPKLELAGKESFNQLVKPLFLPGDAPPEDWIYSVLEQNSLEYQDILGAAGLPQRLAMIRQSFQNASSKPAEIAKNRFQTLVEFLHRSPKEVARIVGKRESLQGPMKAFSDDLEQAIYDWRQRAGL